MRTQLTTVTNVHQRGFLARAVIPYLIRDGRYGVNVITRNQTGTAVTGNFP